MRQRISAVLIGSILAVCLVVLLQLGIRIALGCIAYRAAERAFLAGSAGLEAELDWRFPDWRTRPEANRAARQFLGRYLEYAETVELDARFPDWRAPTTPYDGSQDWLDQQRRQALATGPR